MYAGGSSIGSATTPLIAAGCAVQSLAVSGEKTRDPEHRSKNDGCPLPSSIHSGEAVHASEPILPFGCDTLRDRSHPRRRSFIFDARRNSPKLKRLSTLALPGVPHGGLPIACLWHVDCNDS